MLNRTVQCLETLSVVGLFVLQNSGIDVNIFKPHSTKSASTSKAKLSDAPLADILDKAGWKSEATFAKFYDSRRLWKTRLPIKFCSNVFTFVKLFATSLCICLRSLM